MKSQFSVLPSLFIVLLLAISFPNLSVGAGPEPTVAEVVEVKEGSAGDAIKKMWTSHAVGTSKANDLTQIEVDAMHSFIANKKIAAKNKRLVLVRYEISDPRVVEVVQAALAAGITDIQIITDANVSMEIEFKEGEKFSSRFKDAKFKKNNMAKALQKFLKMGFSFEPGSKLLISSEPIYNKKGDSAIPIMHQKEVYMIDLSNPEQPKVVDGYFGTSNMNGGQRYNRLLQLLTTGVYQDIALNLYLHSQELVKIYGEGKETSDLKTYTPKRFVFPDGSFYEVAFTDGVRNPNERITSLFDRHTKGEIKVTNVLFSHFVFTNTIEMEALKNAMEAPGSTFTVQGVFDQKFISTNGWGATGRMAGFYVDRPMGKDFFPFGKALRDRMELYGYQRLLEGAGKIDPNGPPTLVHIWHDKTTLVDVEEMNPDTKKVEAVTYIFTGSLNNSNHFENAELQVMIRLPTNHKFVQAIKKSILVPARTQKKYSIPLEIAIMRDSIAQFLGKLYMDLTTQEVGEVKKLIKDGNTTALRTRLKKLAKKPSSLIEPPTDAIVEERIENLISYYEWFLKTIKPKTGYTLFPETLERIMTSITKASATGDRSGLQYAIEYTIWWKEITPEEQAELTKMGLKEVFNEEYKPRAPRPPPEEKILKTPGLGGACDTEMKDLGNKGAA